MEKPASFTKMPSFFRDPRSNSVKTSSFLTVNHLEVPAKGRVAGRLVTFQITSSPRMLVPGYKGVWWLGCV